MKALWNETWDFLKKAWFTVPVVLLTAIAYGYSLTHTIVNMDDLAKQYNYDGNVYFVYGRPFRWILEHVTGVIPIHPFATGLIGLLLVILSATCFCVLLKRASGDKLIKPAYPLFACLFITYPLQLEGWLCDWNCIMFGAAYLLAVLAIVCMERACRKARPWCEFAVAAALLAITILMYESFLLVYVCGVFFLLILRWVYGDANDRKPFCFLCKGLMCVLPLAAAFVLKSIIYPGSTGMPGFDITDRVKLLLVRWVLNGKWSFAVQIAIGAVLLSLVCGVVLSVKHHNASILLLIAGFLVSPFLYDILLGSRLPLRSCQTVAVFVGLAGVLVCVCLAAVTRSGWLRTGCCALLFFLCFRQAVDMDKWFVLAEREYNEELTTASGVYTRLITEFTLEKPVQFVGLYLPSDTILEQCAVKKDDPTCRLILDIMDTDAEWYRYAGAGMPYHFQWALDTFGDYDEWAYDHPGSIFEAYFDYHGLRGVTVGTRETYEEANRVAIDMPVWPENGSIRDAGDYIIVKIGEIWIPPDSATPLYTGDAKPVS